VKKAIVAALMMATPAVAADAPRTFDFKGLNTTTVYGGEFMVADKKCKIKAVGLEQCIRFFGAMVGNVNVNSLTVLFNNGHMISVQGSAPNIVVGDLDAAFTAKYGPAESTSNEKWQNQMGATFDNVVKLWKFSDGLLQLKSRGSNRDIAEFVFASTDNQPAKAPPPSNF
jgi:hypothetical protein